MKLFRNCYSITKLADRVGSYQKQNVFSKFSQLAAKTQSTNLGQGFPDYQPSQFIRENIIKSTINNQFSSVPAQGDPMLIKSFKNFIQPFIQFKIDNQVAISHGATTALASTMQALVNPGDEVIIIDPSFDIYRPLVEFCGGKCVGVQLRPKKHNTKKQMKGRSVDLHFQREEDDWELDWKEFNEALSPRTKVVVLNTPQNPVGKIFTKEEINEIAKALDKYPDVWVVSDEAYSHICFDPHKSFQHPRAIDHPKLMNKTVSIFSIGKIFSSSGLRLGGCIGNQKLIDAISLANQAEFKFLNSPFQQGAALSFDACSKNDYFQQKSLEYKQKATDLMQMLIESDINLGLWMPEGGYFVVSDISEVQIPEQYFYEPDSKVRCGRDSAFVYWLADNKKIVAIPLQSFYAPEMGEQNQQYVRWAFCKDVTTLGNAKQRLMA